MMHLRGLVLLLLCLAAGARRSMRINDAHRDAQQQNTLANGLEVSADSREAFIPGGRFRAAGPRAGVSRDVSEAYNPGRTEEPVAKLQDFLITSSPFANLAISALEANELRNQGSDVSMMAAKQAIKKVAPKKSAKPKQAIKKVAPKRSAKKTVKKDIMKKAYDEFSTMDAETRSKFQKMINEVDNNVKESLKAGITPPAGFFDPLGLATVGIPNAGRLLFFREVELKHGRVAMLAALGILVGEQYHPLFGGNIDVPSYIAFQETPLQVFWPAVIAAIAIPEFFSVLSFGKDPKFSMFPKKGKVTKNTIFGKDRVPGDLGFDPLGIRPDDPQELKEMQSKELNHGRLAMLASAGMIAQEVATGQKLF